MSATDSLKADRDALLAICEGLSESQWQAASGCAGWTVKDLVAHMGALYWMMVDQTALPDTGGAGTEDAQEIFVKARREWSPQQTLADYRDVSTKAIEALAALDGVDAEMPLGDLGTYPLKVLPTAYAFDHFTHIRADLFSPRGPLTESAPPVDELRMVPVLDWVQAALPQQNAERVAALPGAVELVVEGAGRRTIPVGSGPTVASVSSDGLAFVRWVTQRGGWDELGVKTSGDPAALAAAAQLKVF